MPFHAPQGVHLVIAIGLPTVFAALAAYWLGGVGPNAPQAVNLAYTVLVSLWSSWRLRTKQGPFLRLWLWVVLTLACFGGQAALEGLPWPHTLAFEGLHLVWFLLGLVQAQIGALWAGQLASRARLFQLTAGVPDGPELEARVRDYQLDADFSRANKTALILSLAALVAVAAVLASVSRYGAGGTTETLFAAFFVLCVLLGVLVRTYRREMESMMYGRRWTWGEKLAPVGWSLLLVAVAGTAAYTLLGIGPWTAGFLLPDSQDSVTASPADETPQAPTPGGRDMRMAVLAALLERVLGVQNLLLAATAFVRAVVVLGPWAAGAFLLWPLIRWLASGGLETRGLLRRWGELLAAQWTAFLVALKAWWGRPLPEPPRSLGTKAAERWLRSFFRPGAPRRHVHELVEAFLRVVAWAEPVAGYRQGETTREFLDRLGRVLPEFGSELSVVRDVLDSELFGTGSDARSRSAFFAAVKTLTSQPPFHSGAPEVS